MINIAFIGNCQMVSLCFFLQNILQNNENYNICYISYDDSFIVHLTEWSHKCKNKIINYQEGIDFLRNCDYVFYQNIKDTTSAYFNKSSIHSYIKPTTMTISISSIHVELNDYDATIKELERRDNDFNNTIKVSAIIKDCIENKNKQIHDLLITIHHPTTFLFMEILIQICSYLNIPFYDENIYLNMIKDYNIMDLPLC